MKRRTGFIAALASAVMVLGAPTAYADDNVRTTDGMQTGLAVWTESRETS